ncbi:MAG: hypothetical protein ACI4LA_07795 [Emergencia sp.]
MTKDLRKIAFKAAYYYLERDPQANLPRLMEWVDKRAADGVLTVQRQVFRKIIEEKDSNWYRLMVSLWDDIDDEVRKTLFENLIINANLLSALQTRENREKYRCNVPWAVCLSMSGGRPEEGEGEGELTFDDLDRIIEESRELGTYIYVLYGDEDLLRKADTIALCNKFEDCQFMGFLSGKNLDEDFAGQLLRVKNFIAALKVTGTEADKELEGVMALLHRSKLPFGTFCIYDDAAEGNFAREEFFDWQIDRGAKFCFFLSSLDEESDYLYGMTRLYRESKPLLTINFCKDKAITGGCMACRYYCAVDEHAMVRPCPFVEEKGADLHSSSLLEAYQSPLFMEYYESTPACRGIKK